MDRLMKGVNETSKKCLHCHQWKSNLREHQKTCKKCPTQLQIVPGQQRGQVFLWKNSKNWTENQEAPSAGTRRKYVPRVEKMLDYFEEKMENFYGNDLLVEGQRLVPQFKEFIGTVEKESMKPLFASSYQFMLTFLSSYVNSNFKQTGNQGIWPQPHWPCSCLF